MQLSRNANRLVWTLMIGAIAMLAYQFRDSIAFLSTGTLTVSDQDEPADTVRLRWVGPVEAPMAARFREAVSEWGRTKRRFVLEISSPGGSVEHGDAVVRVLRDLRRTHELVTVVQSGDHCLSMCVPIYLQGATRLASPRSRWMFHEVRVRDAITNEEVAVGDRTRTRGTDRLFNDYFRPAGVSESWITVTRHAMRSGNVWRTGRALYEEKAGVITELRP
jgi:hypothetical protein